LIQPFKGRLFLGAQAIKAQGMWH